MLVKGDCSQHIHILSKGVGDVEVRGVKTNKLNVEIENKGNIKFMGEAYLFEIISNGRGSFKGKEFEANHATIDLNAEGDINFVPMETIHIMNRGKGSVDLMGKALLKSARMKLRYSGKINMNKVKIQKKLIT